MAPTDLKIIKRLNLMFLLELVAIVAVFFAGGREFIIANKNTALTLSVGLLAFVSVFFSFVYSNVVEKMNAFKQRLLRVEQNLRSEAYRNIFSPEYLRDLADELESLKILKDNVHPEKWLYISVFFFLCYIISAMPNVITYRGLDLTSNLQAVLFHVGLYAVFRLLTSLAAITLITGRTAEKG